MATTTNYSWTTPDDTDLVKDGAAAIRTLGTAIDATVFTNAGAAVAKATVDAKGDLIAGTADNTVARLAVGANGTTLVADSGAATGLAWKIDPVADLVTTAGDTLYATAADTLARLGIGTAGQILQVNSGATAPEWATPAGGGGMTLLASGNLSGSATVTISSISSSYKNLILFMRDFYSTTSAHYAGIRVNGNSSGNNYSWVYGNNRDTFNVTNTGNNEIHLNDGSNGWSGSAADNFAQITFYDYANTTTKKVMDASFIYTQVNATTPLSNGSASYKNATPAAIDSISMIVVGGSNWAGGNYELYGVK